MKTINDIISLEIPPRSAIMPSLVGELSRLPRAEQKSGSSVGQSSMDTNYSSVSQLFAAWGIIRNDSINWRLTARLPGEINGLPGSRGVLLATNGVLCLIDIGEKWLFEGHYAFFTPDDLNASDEANPSKCKPSKKAAVLVAELLC